MSEFGVLFDMDGVIVDSLKHHVEASRMFAEKHGIHLSEKEIREKYFGRRNQDWMPELFGEKLTAGEIKDLADEKEAVFREIYEPEIKLLDGLFKLLQDLRAHDIPMIVGSSAPGENIKFVLEKTAIVNFFNGYLDDSQVSKGKPEPEIYIKAAKAIGLPPQRCIVIEDSAAGIEAGKRAGAKVIGITTTHPREKLPEADLMIDNFHELNYQKMRKLLERQ